MLIRMANFGDLFPGLIPQLDITEYLLLANLLVSYITPNQLPPIFPWAAGPVKQTCKCTGVCRVGVRKVSVLCCLCGIYLEAHVDQVEIYLLPWSSLLAQCSKATACIPRTQLCYHPTLDKELVCASYGTWTCLFCQPRWDFKNTDFQHENFFYFR